ncbi:hypothetical protein Tco_0669776 [Tanacetum coccineum]
MSVHNIYSFYKSESSEEIGEIDIEMLTMEQYLGLVQSNRRTRLMRPEIRGNVNFEIKCQLLQEQKDNTLSENKDEDAYEHVEKVLEITTLFSIPGVSKDAIMLRVFPITLAGAAKRCMGRVPARTVNTWDLLKMVFILRCCLPSQIARQLEYICYFRQDGNETLYQTWERYNDIMFKCPTHDLNDYQQVSIFYKGLEIPTHRMLDSHGPISGITATRTLVAIQEMDDHSQKWHDGASSRGLGGISLDRMSVITNKLNDLGCDMIKLKESVHAIQVGCEMCGGTRLEKNCHLKEEVKSIKATGYGEGKMIFEEWMKRFRESTDKNLKRHDSAIKGLEKKAEQLAQAVHASMTNDSKLANQVKTVATKSSPDTYCSTSLDSNIILCTSLVPFLIEQENVMKTDESNETT